MNSEPILSRNLSVPSQDKHVVLGPSNILQDNTLWKTDGTAINRAVLDFQKELRGRKP